MPTQLTPMPHIAPVDPKHAPPPIQAMFDSVQAVLGGVPNIARTLGQSPVALGAWLALMDATGKGTFSFQTRERVALAVSQENECNYCLAAHCAIGSMAGLDGGQMADARRLKGGDDRETVLLELSRAILKGHGLVPDALLRRARAVGFSDADLLELVTNVIQHTFTNYAMRLAQADIDFPRAPSL